jgi:hypothetical protein
MSSFLFFSRITKHLGVLSSNTWRAGIPTKLLLAPPSPLTVPPSIIHLVPLKFCGVFWISFLFYSLVIVVL